MLKNLLLFTNFVALPRFIYFIFQYKLYREMKGELIDGKGIDHPGIIVTLIMVICQEKETLSDQLEEDFLSRISPRTTQILS